METNHYKYEAFISYVHEDKKYAKKLHKDLENRIHQKNNPKFYTYIKSKIRQNNKENHYVFLDKEELQASGNLTTEIKQSLANSRTLIVICSQNLVKSESDPERKQWVNLEIEEFYRKNINILGFNVEKDNHIKTADCFPQKFIELKIDPITPRLNKENNWTICVDQIFGGIFNKNPSFAKKLRKQKRKWIMGLIFYPILILSGLFLTIIRLLDFAEKMVKKIEVSQIGRILVNNPLKILITVIIILIIYLAGKKILDVLFGD